MSQATELLNKLAEDGMAMYTASPETEEHIVINADRTISVPAALRRIAVQFDRNVETVTFDCPRYWDEHDLSTMVVYINYSLPGGVSSSYPAKNKRIDDSDPSMMHFSWTIGREMTHTPGTITFLVCIKSTDENGVELIHWNSELNKDCYISPGMEATATSTPEDVTDMATLLLQRVDGMDTAYDIALKNGFEGTEKEWLLTLKGEKGDPFTYEDLTEEQRTELFAEHNASNSAHNDIRLLIAGLTNRLNALADSDDTTLDQLSEIVTYIKSNKTLIENVTTSKVNVTDIIDNLTTNVSNKPLSAAQGVIIKSLIDALQAEVNGKAPASHGNHVPATEQASNSRFLRNDNTWQDVTTDNIGAAKIAKTVMNSDPVSVKSVPATTAPYAAITEIGGMSYKCKNLLSTDTYGTILNELGEERNGIHAYINTSGTYTIELASNNNGAIYYGVSNSLDTATLFSKAVTTDENYRTTLEVQAGKYFVLWCAANNLGTLNSMKLFLALGDNVPYEPFFTGLRDSKVTAVESVGVNLIPFPYAHSNNRTAQGVTYSVDVEGKISAKGTWGGTTPARYYLYDDSNGFVMPKDGILRFSIANNNSGARLKPSVTINGKVKYDESSVKVSEGDVITRIAVYTDSSTEIAVDSTATVMLNYGTTALPYTPYRKHTFEIPEAVQNIDGYGQGVPNTNVYNRIVLNPAEGVEKFVKQANRIVFDGINNQLSKSSGVSDDTNYLYFFMLTLPGNIKVFPICNRLEGGSPQTIDSVGWYQSGSALYFNLNSVAKGVGNNKAAINAWLADNPLEVIYALATPEETDVSAYFTDDNLIGVEAGGTITAVNEHEQAVPNTVEFYEDSNEVVGAKTFVGNLHGQALGALYFKNGRIIQDGVDVTEMIRAVLG